MTPTIDPSCVIERVGKTMNPTSSTITIPNRQEASGQKRKLHPNAKDPRSPVEYLNATFQTLGVKVEPSREKNYFIKLTPEMIEAYDKDVIQAVRERDLDKIKKFHAKGTNLQCCNRFGESLIHMACRNGLTEIVTFLVQDANVSLHVRDDYGRTPLHDACWTVKPNFELMDFLIQQAPELLALSDVRGHIPFAYVRKNHWQEWIDFLSEREDLFRHCDQKIPKSHRLQPEVA
jgi:ankyrin repeat protein